VLQPQDITEAERFLYILSVPLCDEEGTQEPGTLGCEKGVGARLQDYSSFLQSKLYTQDPSSSVRLWTQGVTSTSFLCICEKILFL
jgi:hypothetical protein